MTEHVKITVDEGVLILTLNRPEKKNALTKAMYKTLSEALEDAQNDPQTRVVLIRGEGGVFTAGNDLADFAAINQADPNAPRESNPFILSLARVKKPLVAAVNGMAIGIGTTMLLHCDLVFVADDAKLSTPFVNLALVPEAASSLLLQQRIGYSRAFAMFATGEPVLGELAARIGLANQALPSAEVDAAALAAAKALARKPMGSLIATKQLMRDSELLLGIMAREGDIFTDRLKTTEAAEAFQAFAERRAPDFTRVS